MEKGDATLVRALRDTVGDTLRSVVIQTTGGLNPLYFREDVHDGIDPETLQRDIQTLRHVARAEDNLHNLDTFGEYYSTVSLFEDRVIMRVVDGTDSALALSLDPDAARHLNEFVSECQDAFDQYNA